MSDVENLQKQLDNQNQMVNGLLAQLDAHKQMLNEHINGNLVLRTNVVLFQKQSQELNGKIDALNKQIASLNQQLTDATKRIAELEAPVQPF